MVRLSGPVKGGEWQTKVNSDEVEGFLRSVFTECKAQRTFEPPRVKEREIVGSKALLYGEGGSSQGTAYGVVNAVTEFVDHERRTCVSVRLIPSRYR